MLTVIGVAPRPIIGIILMVTTPVDVGLANALRSVRYAVVLCHLIREFGPDHVCRDGISADDKATIEACREPRVTL